ncbi:MAG: zinc ribbon domain-containing protein [Lachnospiraceae bacterium]|nr:zinc ribbon domain-containing protein [Lachnospiraceae bacterium]
MICYKCNEMNADGARFCGRCGTALSAPEPQMQPQPQQTGMQYGQPQPQQGGMQYGQPQPQPPEGHGIVRYHRVFAFLRLLWIPMLFLLYVDMATWTPLVFGDMITFDVAYLPWKFLGVVWSAVSLFIAIRASKLRYPKAGTSVVLSVLGLVSAIFVNLFLMVAEFLGSRF